MSKATVTEKKPPALKRGRKADDVGRFWLKHPFVKGPMSMLDDDLYKFTMANAVLKLYPNTVVTYRFTDRAGKGLWTRRAVRVLQRAIVAMSKLALTPEERKYCEEKFPWINRAFWDFLSNYRYDPSEVTVWLDKKNNLQIEIKGLWCRTILWEVKLLALVSEVYFTEIDTNWTEDGQVEKMEGKALRLFEAGAFWADFSTRRRRHFEAQERVVLIAMKYKNFTGTSNVYLAMKHGVKALGTMAHEWIMGHAALFSLEHANRYAMRAWSDVYHGNLGTALTDTYGTDAFLADLDGELARLFDSARQDSGDPYKWFEKMVARYSSPEIGVDWRSRVYGFTDGNTDVSAIAIHRYVTDKGGRCWFGIGTFMSNDYGEDSPACNIVIKLTAVEVNGKTVPVVKISDSPGKASGDPEAVRVALYTHFGVSLDDPSHAARKAQYAIPVPANVGTCAPKPRKRAGKAS